MLATVALFAISILAGLPSSSAAVASAQPAATLSDDFTHDTSLNPSLWQISGPVGLDFAANNQPGGSANITLTPSFSTAGMDIANANSTEVLGTIQSVAAYTPPFTVTALVEGIVSHGHTIIFGVASSPNASFGVQITANLDVNDCSAETNCGNPSTCGTPANSSIGPNECNYGVYARSGTTGGHWTKTPDLYLTPLLGSVYALEIAVDSSGYAQYNVSQGGQVLGQGNAQIGTGPFYIMMAQGEGSPVPGPGPNQALWTSVDLIPSASVPPPSSPGSSSPGLSSLEWSLIIVLVIAALVAFVLVLGRRRRSFTVTVVDSETLSPLSGAGVSANGPENLSGYTRNDGKFAVGHVKGGEYSVSARAAGYTASLPESVSLPRTAKLTLRLRRSEPRRTGPTPPPEADRAPSPPPSNVEPTPAVRGLPSVAVPPAPPPPPVGPSEPSEMEGWAGGRLREIVETFRAQGALSPETARTAQELGLSRLFVRVMKRRQGRTKVFVEVNGKYYLDERALQGGR